LFLIFFWHHGIFLLTWGHIFSSSLTLNFVFSSS
jgi:hypothetical protein